MTSLTGRWRNSIIMPHTLLTTAALYFADIGRLYLMVFSTVYRPLKKISFNYSDIASVKLHRKKYYYSYTEKITIVTKQGKKIRAENMEMQFERFCKLITANVPNELLTGFD